MRVGDIFPTVKVPSRFRFTTSPATAGDDGAPKWNPIFPADTTRYRSDMPGGEITLDKDFFSAMLENWKKVGAPKLKVDYFHRGNSTDDLPREEKVASGWIIDLRIGATGQLEGLFDWTEEARGRIGRKELQFFSPEFHPDALDVMSGGRQGPTLYGGALLNDPFLMDLPPVAATRTPKETHTMNKLFAAVCAALNLPENTDEDTAMAAFAKAFPPKPAGEPDGDEAKAKMAATVDEAVKMALAPTLSRVESLEKENATLKMAQAKVEAEKVEMQLKELRALALSRGVVATKADEMVADARKQGAAIFFTVLNAMPKAPMLSEVGITGEEATDTQVSAHAKLKAISADIVKKEKVDFSTANEMAYRLNPQLAAIAFGRK